MSFVKIEYLKDPNHFSLIDVSRIVSVNLTKEGDSYRILIDVTGGELRYGASYDTQQDAENAFSSIQNVLMPTSPTETIHL